MKTNDPLPAQDPAPKRRKCSTISANAIPALPGRATLLCLIATAALAAPVEITLPEDTARLVESSLPGYPLAQGMCYTCHSTDYVRTQPFSSRTYWKAAVVKMQKTFGAPIPDDAVEPITDYLVKTYGAERAAAGGSTATPKPASPPAKK